ncbi:DUF1636 domain-containing protein [Acetobacter orleanensis]|uniref:Metal-binding protein n=1 Tax=Acetobacter orleanensis TaxID=104099 RepID=A0A4Y3TLN3_9PROT|nr:DUF1636 domain-containing protein [Acetobacter orleanensis]KXV65431.1 hypothetical protein AD949_04765 [Acetobacter orleanensis]PCD80195.1 DUF1636 domain-containing protein [Acetobacter orleanensis]GAN68447.1 hypothetical protein Abol_015_286 [Acetobacter orleanensis JCM 7639]GBR22785.1 hypothetical protein AA0473_0210 [Acetobacter orleanensis NRIC 0473]GEB82708.1 metal-binding protein [Acetobacter orleanensis]
MPASVTHSASPPASPSAVAEGPVLYVCTTCRRGGPSMEHPPGAQLLDRLHTVLEDSPQSITLRPVACLAACDHGCTASISMPGRWTWLLGNLGPEKAEDLLAYAQLYAASAKGTVMPSRRPASLSDMILGRVPAIEQEPS